jgi:hypothetical protein
VCIYESFGLVLLLLAELLHLLDMLTGQHIAQHHAAFFIREKRRSSLDGNSWCLCIYKAPATLQNQSASHTIYGNQSIKELYVRAQLYIGKRDRIETRSERIEEEELLMV